MLYSGGRNVKKWTRHALLQTINEIYYGTKLFLTAGILLP